MAKKLFKKLGKAAALAAGIYGATRFGKARKKKALNAITDFGADTGTGRFNQAETWDLPVPKVKTPKFRHTPIDPNFNLPGSKDGGRIGAKKGGRVTGCAKRGFGRALKRK